MNRPRLQTVVHHIRSLVESDVETLSDRELLARFVGRRDEAAFGTLVERHGPMVFGVCRRSVRSSHDAEDAWQATFLILAKKAAGIRKQASLAAWLHGVAVRVSAKIRERADRSAHSELPDVAQSEGVDDLTWREVQRMLDEELQRLPDRFRRPLVLCYLEGKTRDEAAGELGWSLTTLRGRLDTAREQLRKRLNRRGVTLPAALLATLLTQAAGASSLPMSRVEGTIQSAVNGTVPAALARLVEGGLRSMSAMKLNVALGLALAVGLFGGGSVIFLHSRGPGDALPLNAAEPPAAPKADDTPKPDAADELAAKVRQSDKIVVYRPGQEYRLIKGSSAIHAIEPLPDWDDRPLAKGQQTTHILFLKSLEEGGQFPKLYPIAPKDWYVEYTPEVEKKVRAAIELPKEWGPVHALGLRMGLLPRPPRFAKGEDIVVDVCIQNTGKKETTIQQLRYNIYDYWLVHFEVTTPSGEKFQLAKPATEFTEDLTPASRTLKPGETYIHTVRLNRWAAWSPKRGRTENDPPPLSAPGTYTVRAFFEPGGKRSEDLGPLTSNVAKFVVNDEGEARRGDVEKHLDRLQITLNLYPDDSKGAASPKHYFRYVMLNVLPIPIEPHGKWPDGKPLGADARISKEQAAKIVAALEKLEFFQHAAGDLPAIETAGPHAKLHIRYRPEGASETKHLWRPLSWNLLMVNHLEAIRACVDGAAAKALDELLKTLEDDKKAWTANTPPATKLDGRWPLVGQVWDRKRWAVPEGTTGECMIEDKRVRITISTDQGGFRQPNQEFAGTILPGAVRNGLEVPTDPDAQAIGVKGEWSWGKVKGKEAETTLWFNPKAGTLKIATPAEASTYFVFERKPAAKPDPKIDSRWGDPDGGVSTLLEVAKKSWPADAPIDLTVSVLNKTGAALPMPRMPRCEVEVDGVWYTGSPAEAPVAGAYVLGSGQVGKFAVKLESGKWIEKSVLTKLVPLKLAPGKHTIRVACMIDKRRPVSNAVEIAIGDAKDASWGEASDGLQLRLRAAKTRWRADEKPSFALDLRNGSKKELAVGAVPEECLIELNGTLYRYGDGITHGTPVRPIKPDEQVEEWLTVLPSEKWIADGTILRVFHWNPGKNQIRVSFPFNAKCRPFSNAVEIEIVDPKETGWGEPNQGVQVRARPTRTRYEANDRIVFDIDLRNQGAKDWKVSPDSSAARIEVDGIWYVSPTVWWYFPVPVDLKIGAQLDKFATIFAGKFWFKQGGGYPAPPLDWKPGKHTVRVEWPVPDQSRTVSAPFEIEIAESKDLGWGEAVDGLQLRGRATKARWTIDEKPAFELDLRNQSTKKWTVTAIPLQTQIELDGAWFDYKLPLSYPATEQTLEPSGKFEPWLKVAPNSDWSKRGDMNVVLEWKPGKHTIRLGYGFGVNVRAITAPFEIEIVDPKELGWGKPVGDFQVRLRAGKSTFRADEVPVFELDLRNGSKQEVNFKRHPQFALIQVDEWWYFSPMSNIEPASGRVNSGEQIDTWVNLRLKSGSWLRSEKDWIGPAPLSLSPGKHTIRAAYPAHVVMDAALTYYLANVKIEMAAQSGQQAINAAKAAISEAIWMDLQKNKLPVSNAVEFVIAEPKDADWGKEEKGMQARIRPTKKAYAAGETPEFALDLRNVGKEDVVANKFAAMAEVELDGVWYFWPVPDIGFPSGQIKAGEQADRWVKVELKGGEVWHLKTPNDKSPKFLTLTPGKHAVRMAYLVTGNVMPVSAPVEIEIVDDKSTGWGKEDGGFRARLREANPRRRADEPAAFYLDLKNVGTKDVEVGRWELLAEIELDGAWHRLQTMPLIGYPTPTIKAGEQVDRFVEIRLEEGTWRKGLKVAPGKHTVRIAYRAGNLAKPVTNSVEFEVADGKETGWGDAVEGLQLRGRSVQTVWQVGQSPGFEIDMRNRGDREWPVESFQAKTEIEVDGTWYACSILMNDTARAVRPLKPGNQLDHWVTIHPDYTYRARKDRDAFGDKLEWKPGKHTIRLAYPVRDKVKPIGAAFEIEVVDLKEELHWGKAVNGLQARLRAGKTSWRTDEKPTFTIDLRNQGTKTWETYPVPFSCKIVVDGVTYRFTGPVGYVAPKKVLKPNEQIDGWVAVTPDELWMDEASVGVGRPLAWTVGKHRIAIGYTLDKDTQFLTNEVEVEAIDAAKKR